MQTLFIVLQLIWIDVLLSGDNAIVIALAARALPLEKQNLAIGLGVAPAVVLRIIFTLCVAWLMTLPYLQIVGSIVLAYVAVKMLLPDGDDAPDSVYKYTMLGAAATIVAADLSMSIDNVVAVAAAAKGHPWLIGFGLLLSMPLIIAGSKLVMWLMEKAPLLVWLGGALLGWIAAGLLLGDPQMAKAIGHELPELVRYAFQLAGAGVVVGAALTIKSIKGDVAP